MTRRKRLLVGVAIGALLLGTGTARALIPVFDGSAVAELFAQFGEAEKAFALQIAEYTTQIHQFIGENFSWVTQYGQYITEISHYMNDAQMLLNLSHHPTLGAAMGLLNQAGLTSSLPFNPMAAMNLINGLSYNQGGFGEVNGLLNTLSGLAGGGYQQSHLYTPTDTSWASAQLVANSNSLAGSQGAAMAAYTDYSNHLGVLPTLRQNAASATNTKDALDTANQLQSEIAWNVNEMGRAQQVATLSQLQQQSRIQRDEERLACELEQFRSPTPQPCPTGANGALAGGGGGPNGGSDTMPVPPAPPLPPGSGAAMANGPDPVMPIPPQVAPPPAFEMPAAPPVAGPPAPGFADPNNPANNNAALANVLGGDGQEINLGGPVAPNVTLPVTQN